MFEYNGNSVIDYCMVSKSLFRNVLYFHVQGAKPLLSDKYESCRSRQYCYVMDLCVEYSLMGFNSFTNRYICKNRRFYHVFPI